jgi:hypothetical protein
MSTPHRPSPPPAAPPAKPPGSGPDMLSIGMGLAVVLLALPAALGALWARRFVKSRQRTVAMLALVGGLLFAAVCLKPFKAHITESRDTIKAAKTMNGLGGFFSAATGALPLIWLYTLPLTPILTLVWDSVRPKSLDEQQTLEGEKKQEKAQLAVDSARRRISHAVVRGLEPKDLAPGVDSAAVLAAKISGGSVFFAREYKKLLYLNTDTGASSLHMLFAGENGSGKTVSMLRVAAAIAAVTEWDIFFVNPKNDRDTMQTFYDLMLHYDRPCRLFPQEAYNGWEGDSGALLSRIMAIPGYATEGAASYYSDMAEVYLRAVLNTGEPMPTSFEELERRLDYDRLAAQYEEHPAGFARVSTIRKEDAKGVVMRFAMMTPKLSMIRGDGWKLADTRAAYFGLPIMANERDAQALAKFLLEDIKHYLSVRKDPRRRAVFILDEFSSLGTESVIRLAEMARSLGGIIMLGTQTLAGLGDLDQQQRIVGNVSVLLHRMSAPEELTRLAGVQEVMVKTGHYQGKERVKRGTYRIEDADIIPAQDVRTLPTGCAWVIARGVAAKVQMGMPPDVPEVPIIIQRKRPAATAALATVRLAAPAPTERHPDDDVTVFAGVTTPNAGTQDITHQAHTDAHDAAAAVTDQHQTDAEEARADASNAAADELEEARSDTDGDDLRAMDNDPDMPLDTDDPDLPLDTDDTPDMPPDELLDDSRNDPQRMPEGAAAQEESADGPDDDDDTLSPF